MDHHQQQQPLLSEQRNSIVEQSLEGDDVVGDGSVDIRGRPSKTSTSGRWKAVYFIMATEFLERLVYYGICFNLLTYLVDVLHEDTAQSVSNLNNWQGLSWILPLFGAFVADEFLGRYTTIVVSGFVYILALVGLTLSVTLPSMRPSPCLTQMNCEPASSLQAGFFFGCLYLVSIGVGGMKPCLSTCGADQFNEENVQENAMKHSFFNYWWLSICGGSTIALTGLVYVEDRVSWGWGYGLLALSLLLALGVFLAGTPWYRHKHQVGSPLIEVTQVLVAAIRKWHVPIPSNPCILHEVDCDKIIPHTNTCRFLDKAAMPTMCIKDHSMVSQANVIEVFENESSFINPWHLCSVTQVEEVKLLVRLMPMWLSSLVYIMLFTLLSTISLRQGMSMDLSTGPYFKIPPASLELFTSITAMVFIPLYDIYLVPLMRRFTGDQRGITLLQRIGIGFIIAILAMIVATLVESKRLKVVQDYGMENNPSAIIPMSVYWLAPQYILSGISQVFGFMGQLEFFYDQAPDNMQTLGTALFTTSAGIAHFLNTLLLNLIVVATTRGGHQGWIVANINKCRLDLFYGFLASLGYVGFLVYLLVAHRYTYKKTSNSSLPNSTSQFKKLLTPELAPLVV
jgi:peptide/histidine transporter 3/4